MTEQTIFAVYDTAAHADAAIRDLEAANVPSSAISRHAKETAATGSTAREPGFWASLFGGSSADSDVYDRSVESGSTVVTVNTPEQHITRVNEILEAHDPIDFDERAGSYGTTETVATTVPVAPSATATATDSGNIQLAAETLAVGKRAVNRGTTRVRRYVVETPAEEQISLHSETVQVDRRPVTGGRAVTGADFADKTIEMTETSEEAIVGKTAHVVEEISLRKEGAERVETVRDTVRHQEVEIETVPAVEAATATKAAPAAAPLSSKR